MFLDFACGKYRIGGSSLAQAYSQLGDVVPDMDDPATFKAGWEATQELVGKQLVEAGHDRSDGGLIGCLLEMAFAGNCGFKVTLPGRKYIKIFINQFGRCGRCFYFQLVVCRGVGRSCRSTSWKPRGCFCKFFFLLFPFGNPNKAILKKHDVQFHVLGQTTVEKDILVTTADGTVCGD